MKLSFWKKKKKRQFDITTEVRPSSRISSDSTVGKYCYIGERCDVTKSNIGNYVSVGNNVTIGAGEHHVHEISTSSIFYTNPYAELTRGECSIGHDAWIGVDAIVRRGVRVGIGAVVGANSFVNSDVPDFGIVAGSPARFIRYRFDEAERRLILDSRWWEADLNEARVIISDLKIRISRHLNVPATR